MSTLSRKHPLKMDIYGNWSWSPPSRWSRLDDDHSRHPLLSVPFCNNHVSNFACSHKYWILDWSRLPLCTIHRWRIPTIPMKIDFLHWETDGLGERTGDNQSCLLPWSRPASKSLCWIRKALAETAMGLLCGHLQHWSRPSKWKVLCNACSPLVCLNIGNIGIPEKPPTACPHKDKIQYFLPIKLLVSWR